jgi:hypothetical protein
MKFIPETIGDAIFAFVRQNYRSNKDAARDFGISQPYLSSVIRGTRKPPSVILRKMGVVVAYVPADRMDDSMFPVERRQSTEMGSHSQHVGAHP